MDVDFGTSDEGSAPSGIVRCHCPAVSRIGGLDLAGRPCLVSDSRNPKRKMPLTVEAFSLQQPDDPDKRWIGINQNASNRYVEHFLREGAFATITGPVRTVRREVPLGDSRLDFLANDDLYLEVKTPLVQMQTDIPPYVPRLPEAPFLPLLRQLRVPLLPRHHLRGSARHGGRLPGSRRGALAGRLRSDPRGRDSQTLLRAGRVVGGMIGHVAAVVRHEEDEHERA